MLLSGGKGLPRNPIGAARSFKQACDIGLESACTSLAIMVKTDGDGVLLQPCSRGDGKSCFMLGSLYYGGQGVSATSSVQRAFSSKAVRPDLRAAADSWGRVIFPAKAFPRT